MIKLTDLLKEVLDENEVVLDEAEQLNEIDPVTAGLAGAALGTWRAAKGTQRATKNTGSRGVGTYLKQFAKGALGLPDERAAKKKGSTWKTPSGRVGAKNRAGKISYFKDETAAKKFATS